MTAVKIGDAKHRPEVTEADISASVFRDVNLSGSRFADCDMSGSQLDDVNLTGLRLTNANLAGASISRSRYEGMTIDGVDVVELLSAYRTRMANSDGTSA